MNDGGMNEWLADFYGTGGHTDAEELEKAAQAALLEKLAEEGDLDIDSLTDDEVVELAESLGITAEEEVVEEKTASAEEATEEATEENIEEQLEFISKVAAANDIDIDALSDEELEGFAARVLDPATWEEGETAEISDREKISMINKVAAANDIDIDELSEEQFQELSEFALNPENWVGEEQVKEAEAKFAEADFLGRVMAHAQYNELRKIAEAAEAAEEVEEAEIDKEAASKKALREKLMAMLMAPKKTYKATKGGFGQHHATKDMSEKAKVLEALKRTAKKHPAHVAGAAGAAGGAGALAAS